MTGYSFGALLLGCITLVTPISAVSGTFIDGRNGETLSLLQLAVPYERRAEFTLETRKIRSCDQAREIALTLNADVAINESVSSISLPKQLVEILEDIPAGHATAPFGQPGGTIRVFVLCGRNPPAE